MRITDAPLEPDGPEARDWLIRELSDPAYQNARPTWFDTLAQGLWDWIGSLLSGDGVAAPPALAFAVVIALVVAGAVVALLVFGVPRADRRSRLSGALFGEDDARTAAEMRSAARRAADRGDHAEAMAEMFRAIARRMAERGIVETSPGTTARGFAARAGSAFPAQSPRLTEAAALFDLVRYLGGSGSREDFERLSALEADLRDAPAAGAAEVAAASEAPR